MSIIDKFKLEGKVAIVTGCKRGIGKAMAVGLAEAGADIIGVSATLETSGSDVENEVTNLGRNFAGYACDFSDREAVYDFIAKVFPVCLTSVKIIIKSPYNVISFHFKT